jgi:hypothetical protein
MERDKKVQRDNGCFVVCAIALKHFLLLFSLIVTLLLLTCSPFVSECPGSLSSGKGYDCESKRKGKIIYGHPHASLAPPAATGTRRRLLLLLMS